ncbi:2-amino-4-hydroxy-6-hydroxymethyldihydropteridine pyrophosphokinase [Mycobacterium kiyosense]|uniref:2-amino-4-hydroxy-6-hydroxymethyldihydropteridine diphosphokinase n=1 Tax=Mycobacterium kiyosense TaxID=2871094 RepID=A0A9P3V069_9MYCO|nr:2-amino-4-hydroxy-6-hydroxymethyldihydropteridine pyrophosphokinase [Mycobacterium kiyosense]BDE16820.1 2-amino-4-hydroxy-6-hydroxymethyldihydropteridine pyrophosphokinase [Mycobacterium sp. 20KCMC460]GLB83096.1 2-amino-4-hydroxy-6-hydroxymethyldihydropteridine pyrophosphokinase [Mycobacterium kiyosense]GLB90702.1 2-amino-4-hydroxy-6-hydroxymethyldihydropteridine pyrophosphokinase [Mycobacterium kiyosense]GLB97394.1 2-amino-4-hydroxy-6-hydroxymethyldihydropteridine pyrophosphokinase [Mycobac
MVLSIGSNLGDRRARLQSVITGLAGAVVAVSPVYETDPWGGVEQDPFLNAVLIADDPACDARGWLHRAGDFERAAQRERGLRWGPRTLDVDLIACYDGHEEIVSDDPDLTLPHPRAHLRAFVLIPWLDVDPGAVLTLADGPHPVAGLLARLHPDDRAGVRPAAVHLGR